MGMHTTHLSRRAIGMLLVSVLLAGMSGVSSAVEPSDVELLLANEKAWAKAPVDGDADRMASFMADEYFELVWEPATPTTAAHCAAPPQQTWVPRGRPPHA